MQSDGGDPAASRATQETTPGAAPPDDASSPTRATDAPSSGAESGPEADAGASATTVHAAPAATPSEADASTSPATQSAERAAESRSEQAPDASSTERASETAGARAHRDDETNATRALSVQESAPSDAGASETGATNDASTARPEPAPAPPPAMEPGQQLAQRLGVAWVPARRESTVVPMLIAVVVAPIAGFLAFSWCWQEHPQRWNHPPPDASALLAVATLAIFVSNILRARGVRVIPELGLFFSLAPLLMHAQRYLTFDGGGLLPSSSAPTTVLRQGALPATFMRDVVFEASFAAAALGGLATMALLGIAAQPLTHAEREALDDERLDVAPIVLGRRARWLSRLAAPALFVLYIALLANLAQTQSVELMSAPPVLAALLAPLVLRRALRNAGETPSALAQDVLRRRLSIALGLALLALASIEAARLRVLDRPLSYAQSCSSFEFLRIPYAYPYEAWFTLVALVPLVVGWVSAFAPLRGRLGPLAPSRRMRVVLAGFATLAALSWAGADVAARETADGLIAPLRALNPPSHVRVLTANQLAHVVRVPPPPPVAPAFTVDRQGLLWLYDPQADRTRQVGATEIATVFDALRPRPRAALFFVEAGASFDTVVRALRPLAARGLALWFTTPADELPADDPWTLYNASRAAFYRGIHLSFVRPAAVRSLGVDTLVVHRGSEGELQSSFAPTEDSPSWSPPLECGNEFRRRYQRRMPRLVVVPQGSARGADRFEAALAGVLTCEGYADVGSASIEIELMIAHPDAP